MVKKLSRSVFYRADNSWCLYAFMLEVLTQGLCAVLAYAVWLWYSA